MVIASQDLTRWQYRPGPRTTAAIAALLLLVAGIFVHRYVILHDHPLFWDLRVYIGAIKAHSLSLDPYLPEVFDFLGVDKQLKYTSTPLVNDVFGALSRVPLVETWFEPVFLIIHIGAIISIVWTLTALFLGTSPTALLLGAAIFSLMFSTAGLNTFAAANNGTALYGLIVLCVYRGFIQQRWAAFHACVTLAVAVKPIYAPLWVIPVFADRFSLAQLKYAIVGGVVATCSYLAYVLTDPAIVTEWLSNLQTQAGQTTNDLGANVFAGVYAITKSHIWWPVAAQLTCDIALMVIVLSGHLQGRRRWAALIVVAIFLNPRLMAYDAAIASIPIIALAAHVVSIRAGFITRVLLVTYPLTLGSIVLPYRTIDLVPAAFLQPALVLVILLLVATRSWSIGGDAPICQRPAI